jgi:hypothetical protein
MNEINNQDTKEFVIQSTEIELSNIMDEWCKINDNGCSGGKMREKRGSDIETFVRATINMVGKLLHVNLHARCGNNDKKILVINQQDGKKINKLHQVDVHIYLNDVFVAVIECKSYLDSCYYVRACDDFKMFKKFDYNVKNYIFTLENAIDENTKLFTDFMNDYICDNIFYMLPGKRTFSKPVYDIKHKKSINKKELTKFVEFIFTLCKVDEKNDDAPFTP